MLGTQSTSNAAKGLGNRLQSQELPNQAGWAGKSGEATVSLLVLFTCAAHPGHQPPPLGPGSRGKEVRTSTRLRMGASIAHPVNLQRPSSGTHRPPVPGWVVRSAPSATGLLLKLGTPLGPRARAHHPRPLPLIHTKELRPELLKFLKHLPIVASRASYLLAAPRPPPPCFGTLKPRA